MRFCFGEQTTEIWGVAADLQRPALEIAPQPPRGAASSAEARSWTARVQGQHSEQQPALTSASFHPARSPGPTSSLRAPLSCALFHQQKTTDPLCFSGVDCVAGFLRAQSTADAGTLCSVAVITETPTPAALLGGGDGSWECKPQTSCSSFSHRSEEGLHWGESKWALVGPRHPPTHPHIHTLDCFTFPGCKLVFLQARGFWAQAGFLYSSGFAFHPNLSYGITHFSSYNWSD